VSSGTRLLVLGCVRAFQPVHGYDVRRELMSWHANEWANVAPGSIYNALKTLVKDGALEIVGTGAVGGRPERTSYKLTTRGEDELADLLRDTWWNVAPLLDPLMPGLAFLQMMTRDEAITALEHRGAQIRARLAQGEFLIASFGKDASADDEHVREMMRLSGARLAAELEWSAAFIGRLRKGEYTLAGEKPKPRKKR
jgi:DNA-binding PadR family transcriptional regulator